MLSILTADNAFVTASLTWERMKRFMKAQYTEWGFDLDGRSGIDRFLGVVDIGAYEHVPHGTMCAVP